MATKSPTKSKTAKAPAKKKAPVRATTKKKLARSSTKANKTYSQQTNVLVYAWLVMIAIFLIVVVKSYVIG